MERDHSLHLIASSRKTQTNELVSFIRLRMLQIVVTATSILTTQQYVRLLLTEKVYANSPRSHLTTSGLSEPSATSRCSSS